MVKDGNIQDRARALHDCVRDFRVCVPSTFPSEMTLNFSSSTTLNLAASDCDDYGFSFGCLVVFSRGYCLSLYFSIDPIDATNLAMSEFLNEYIHDGDVHIFNMFHEVHRDSLISFLLLSSYLRSSVSQDSSAPDALSIRCSILPIGTGRSYRFWFWRLLLLRYCGDG